MAEPHFGVPSSLCQGYTPLSEGPPLLLDWMLSRKCCEVLWDGSGPNRIGIGPGALRVTCNAVVGSMKIMPGLRRG